MDEVGRRRPAAPAPPGDEAIDDLADQLSGLGRALGNPTRVRIAAALLETPEASPSQLAELLNERLGNLSYHIRYLVTLGLVELERTVPRRGALEHFYRLKSTLRRALPAAAGALSEPARDQPSGSFYEPPASPDDLLDLSYFLLPTASGVRGGLVTEHAVALSRVGRALSDELRVEILAYLVHHGHATTTDVARGMDIPRRVIAEHVRQLADLHMIEREAGSRWRWHWKVTPPMEKAIGGFYEYLLAIRELRAAAAHPGSGTARHPGCSGNGNASGHRVAR